MKVKMYPANATSMPAFDVLHPKLVHQIVLIQNPTKVCALPWLLAGSPLHAQCPLSTIHVLAYRSRS
jgi:hypothetical protein